MEINKHNLDLNKIKLNIKAQRSYLGMTQEKMANNIQLNKTTYNAKENNPETFKLLEIVAILDTFQKTFEEIFIERRKDEDEKKDGKTEKEIE